MLTFHGIHVFRSVVIRCNGKQHVRFYNPGINSLVSSNLEVNFWSKLALANYYKLISYFEEMLI